MNAKAEAWKTDNWWVSHWNFVEDRTKGLEHLQRLKVYDVTLRDGEQQAGIVFTKDDKIRIAEELAALGVHCIEAGMPVVSEEDAAAVKEIARRKLGPEIFAGCRSIADEVKRAADCGVDGVNIGTPASKQLIEQGLGWQPERAVENAVRATRLAHELGLKTNFFPIDGSRTDRDWYFTFVEQVARDGHIDNLIVSDTFGALSPEGAMLFVKTARERIKKPVEIHFHNSFGLAVANTIAGVLGGAEVMHTAITGIGEGAGNACTEEIVAALRALYGVDVGIRYDRLYSTAKLVRGLAGTAANRPIVGESTYDIETGEGVLFFSKVGKQFPTITSALLPRYVGHPETRVVLGKKSGADALLIWAEKLGLTLNKEEAKALVGEVKKRALDVRRSLNEDEFRDIVRDFKARQ